ncbi:MAG: MobA protein [Muribaculaceae bacterium]|nr:MobA protein [Muribaculaceae bacterium]
MKQNFNQGGRPPKVNPAINRYVVRFDAIENEKFLSRFEKSGATTKAAFIKGVLLDKPFKVFVVDENSRVFIDQLSAMHSRYRSICVDYDLVAKTLRENFTEKKAMKALYQLEQQTIELVKLNKQIVTLANAFDAQWRADEDNQ